MDGAFCFAGTATIDFTASGFSSVFNDTPVPPFDPVTGSFTITLDPTQTYTDEASGIVLNNLSIGAPSTILFNYDPATDLLLIGSDPGGVFNLIASVSDIGLAVLHFLSAPVGDEFG